jgi:hypothetical protein
MQPFAVLLPFVVSVFVVRILPRILLAPVAVVLLVLGNRLAAVKSKKSPGSIENRGLEDFLSAADLLPASTVYNPRG